MNDNVEIIRSNKGGLKLIHRGYMYTVHKKRQGGGIRWRCTQRSLHCKGSISTGNGPPSVNMPHNHIPDPHSVALARCRQLEEFPDINSLLETEYDEIKDAMPLQQRVLLNPPPQLQIPSSSESSLQSQPLSPTKLKVSRQVGKPQTYSRKMVETPPEEVCLRWNSHHSNMQTTFPQLLESEKYVDVTVIAEGKMLKCHKMILSSCSTYFEEVLNDIMPLQHPVIILKGIPFWILKALIDFMYVGEVNIDQNKLPELLDTAEMLKVKGLAGKTGSADKNDKPENQPTRKPQPKDTDGKQPVPKTVLQPIITVPKTVLQPIITKEEEMPVSDPLELLEPKLQEDSDGMSSKNKDGKLPVRKTFTRKFRKRKTSEDEATPPLFPMRRGTRSRPNVKIPKYYDYEDIVKPTTADIQALSPGVNIKSEPIDVEESDVSYHENVDVDTEKHSFLSSVGVNPKLVEKNVVSKDPVARSRSVSRDKDQPPPMYKIKVKRFSSLIENTNNVNNKNEHESVVKNEVENIVTAQDKEGIDVQNERVQSPIADIKSVEVDEQKAHNDSTCNLDVSENTEGTKAETADVDATESKTLEACVIEAN